MKLFSSDKASLKCSDINIRDPFVVCRDGKYYLYGTRARNFGVTTGGFDVYVSDDLVNWSQPHECFNSEDHNLNFHVNWAPEVHEYIICLPPLPVKTATFEVLLYFPVTV